MQRFIQGVIKTATYGFFMAFAFILSFFVSAHRYTKFERVARGIAHGDDNIAHADAPTIYGDSSFCTVDGSGDSASDSGSGDCGGCGGSGCGSGGGDGGGCGSGSGGDSGGGSGGDGG